MSVSIVTPTYNGSRFLARTIEGVLAQSYRDWEYVILDDGSTDNSAEIAEGFANSNSRIRTFRSHNQGVANARNFGYSLTSPATEFVIFLDQDDTWTPDALQKLVNKLSSDPHAAAAHALSRQADANDQASGETDGGTIWNWERRKIVGRRIETCARTEPTTFEALICDCTMPTPGVVLIRRSAFEKMRTKDSGCFDQSVAPGDDWDAWIRLSLHGHFAFLDEVILNWRIHDANVSNNERKMLRAELSVRDKARRLPGLSEQQRHMAQWRFTSRYGSALRKQAEQLFGEGNACLRSGDWNGAGLKTAEAGRLYSRYLSLKTKDKERFSLDDF